MIYLEKYNTYVKSEKEKYPLQYQKRKKKWVYYIVTQENIDRYVNKHPNEQYTIKDVSYRILCMTEKKLNNLKMKYKVGDLYKGEIIIMTKDREFSELLDRTN